MLATVENVEANMDVRILDPAKFCCVYEVLSSQYHIEQRLFDLIITKVGSAAVYYG